tara:strand:- start:1044 stop:1274 length:231 start_codon:yes stop_codon:yes gene_type:complete
MSYLNKQNIKALAKEYGKQQHNKELQISADFIKQIEHLVEAIVKTNVVKQDKLSGTLRNTEWAKGRLLEAKQVLND